jgi:hypothetical protein
MKWKNELLSLIHQMKFAGDSDIPHSGIGRARRMQVAKLNYNIKL